MRALSRAEARSPETGCLSRLLHGAVEAIPPAISKPNSHSIRDLLVKMRIIWRPLRILLTSAGVLGLFSGTALAALEDGLKEASVRSAPSLETVQWYRLPEQDSQSLQGKVLLVNFWATWCPPCVEELPSIQRVWETFSRDDFDVIAINAGEDVETIEEFLTELPTALDFPIVMDRRLESYKDWQVRPLPTTFLVDRAGKIRYQAIGPRDFASDNIRSTIQDLIDEQVEANH